jgi:hypothetical protein
MKKIVKGLLLAFLCMPLLITADRSQTTKSSLRAGEPWLSGWHYRKNHVINSTTGAGTDYQMKITVHYGSGSDSAGDVYCNSHCKTDFSDIRFTSSDGVTLLSAWNQSQVNGDNVVTWVKIQDDLTSSGTTIYIYYGNSGVSVYWSGSSTFIEFDSGGSPVSGDLWAATAESSDSNWISGSQLDVTVGSTVGALGGNRNNVFDFEELRPSLGQKSVYVSGCGGVHYGGMATSLAVDFDYYIQTLSSYDNCWAVWVYVAFKYSDVMYKVIRLKDAYFDGWEWRTTQLLNNAPPTHGIDVSTDDITVYTTDSIQTWYSKSIKSTDYCATTYPTDVYIGVDGGHDNCVGYGSVEAYFQTIRIRKYVSPEPSQGSWGSEERIPYVAIISVNLSPILEATANVTCEGISNTTQDINYVWLHFRVDDNWFAMNMSYNANTSLYSALIPAYNELANKTIQYYIEVLDKYGTTVTSNVYSYYVPDWVKADVNRDGKVDMKDIAFVAKNFGKPYP